MELVHADSAVVDLRKINDYLLSLTHPEGRTKARFFISHGFTPGEHEVLVAALLLHARTGKVRLSRRNVFGNIHTVKGPMPTPDGRTPTVESVWIVEFGSELMITEHDMVVLTSDMVVMTARSPKPELKAGDVGTVVHIYRDGEAYEIEFSTMQGGAPFALVTVTPDQVRPLGSRDLFHVRELAA